MKAVLLALLMIAAGLASAAAQPLIRIQFTPDQPLVGQQVRLAVTVLAPNFFLSPPRFPTFDIPGAVVTLLDENGINSTEKINGETYAGIQRTYSITPQIAGPFTLPPAQITFSYAAEPGKPGVAASLPLPPQLFTARLAGGSGNATAGLVAKVTVAQTIDGDPKVIKVGDALTRTVEIVAANTQAMMIPPPTFEAPADVRVYAGDPVLSDVKTDRGGFVGGRRVDRVTYVFETPGTFTLPAIEIGWLNAQTGKQEVAAAPAIAVSVAPAPAPAAADDLAPPPPPPDVSATDFREFLTPHRALIVSAGLVAVLLAVIAIVLRFWTDVRAWMQGHRQARDASEAAVFGRLTRACNAGDPVAAYRELGQWARCQGFSTIRGLGQAEPTLRSAIASLERHLYGDAAANWNGRAFARAAGEGRASRHRARSHHSHQLPALPALNP